MVFDSEIDSEIIMYEEKNEKLQILGWFGSKDTFPSFFYGLTSHYGAGKIKSKANVNQWKNNNIFFFLFSLLWADLKSNHEKAIEAMKLIDSNMLCQGLILTRSK